MTGTHVDPPRPDANPSPDLARQWQHLPAQPGVYLFRNAKREIIYIGKATSLADRVRSYFAKSADHSPKTLVLTSLVHEIETVVTQSELEALLLESNLIKRHRPRFNVVLRDDKQYPYLRLPIKDDFPRLSIVRRVKPDKALYFGPYVPTGAMRETLKIIRKVFPLATCTIDIDGTADRACLEFEIKRCMAPCTGHQTKADYHRLVQQVRMFLEGRDGDLVASLRRDMHDAADRQHFEEAARLRDRILKIEKTLEKQRVTQVTATDQDVFGLARSGSAANLQLLFVRGGLLIGRRNFQWAQTHDTADYELIRSSLEQFYSKNGTPPKEILVPTTFPDKALFEAWLSEKKGARVTIRVPERGAKAQLLTLARENAAVALEHDLQNLQHAREARDALAQLLQLSSPPRRIEGFDISNTMGAHSVASMVVWEEGAMKKSDYRRFTIQSVDGANDFASMAEVIKRRYGGTLATDTRKALPFPDVILIDGGLGQLHAAYDVLTSMTLPTAGLFGLAKAKGQKDERIYRPGQRTAVVLDPHSPVSHLVQRIRDEAHRFALRFHRKRRALAMFPDGPSGAHSRRPPA